MAWSKDNSRAAKLAAEEALAQAQRAESGADYIAEVTPKIDEFVGDQTNLQTQLNDLVLQSGTDIAEVVQARGGEVTLNARLEKTTAQLAETSKYVNDRGINVRQFEHLKVGVTGGFDWQPVVQAALDSITSGSVILPPFPIQIHSSITVSDNKKILGNYYGSSIVEIKSDINGILLKGSRSSLENLQVKISYPGYTESAVVFSTYAGGHVIKPFVSKLTIQGNISMPKGNAIKIAPTGGKVIMGIKIEDIQFRGVENCILVESAANGFNGFVNRAVIRDCWEDFCVNGITTLSNLDDTVIENFCGQFSEGKTQTFINHQNGDRLVIRDSSLSDGGVIFIGEKAKNTKIDGGLISSGKIVDKGYHTVIKQGIIGDWNKFRIEKEYFRGNDISNKWLKTITGSGSIGAGTDTSSVPFASGAILSTGGAINSTAVLNYGKKYQYDKDLHKVISFKFRVSNINDFDVLLGFKNAFSINKGVFWHIKDGLLYPSVFTNNAENSLSPIIISNTFNLAQIILREDGAYFHLNGSFIGKIESYEITNYEPHFQIENKVSAEKKLVLTDVYVRTVEY